MGRDYRKLVVFHLADEVVTRIYTVTADFPDTERYGLVSQIRRAAISIPCNIVEGCARRKTGEYLNFISIAAGSANETRYCSKSAIVSRCYVGTIGSNCASTTQS